MKVILFVTIISIAFVLNGYGSDYKLLRGKVFDKNGLKDIPFASIYINHTGYGTITNEMGEFQLYYPASISIDSFTISCIGYYNVSLRLSDYDADTLWNKFYLKEAIYDIDGVYITDISCNDIIARFVKNYKLNYSRKPYYQEGFYRELTLNDNTYTRLIEAAFSIYDKGYDTDNSYKRIKINELRKSESYIQLSSQSQQLKKFYGKEVNNLVELSDGDIIRFRDIEKGLKGIDKDFCENFDCFIKDIIMQDTNQIYVIGFSSKNPSDNAFITHEGSLYIDKNDYAVIRYNMDFIVGNPDVKKYFIDNKYLKRISVVYRKINDNYFLNYISAQKVMEFSFSSLRDENDEVKNKQYYNLSMNIINTITDSKEYDRIKNRDDEKPDLDLYKMDFNYDEEFWKNYNILLINPLLKKAQTDLEKDGTLEEQFKNN